MKRLVITFVLMISLCAPALALPGTVRAQSNTGCEDAPTFFLGLPTWYKYLELDENCDVVGPNKPGTDELDWQKAGGFVGLAIIEFMVRVATIITIGYVIYGGIRYILSQGEPDGIKNARQTITNGLIGLVISLIAVGIVAFITSQLTK